MENKTFKSYSSLIVFIFFLSVFIYLINSQEVNNSEDFIFWASLNFWLFCSPIILYFKGSERSVSYFPFIGLLGLSLLVSFGIPPFVIDAQSYQLNPLTIESLKISFWAYLVLFVTFYLFRKVFIKIKPYEPIKTFEIKKVRNLNIIFLLIYLLSISFISTILQLGDFTLFIYLGLNLFFISKKINLSFIEKATFGSVLVYEITRRIISGLAAPFLVLTLFVVIVDYVIYKQIRKKIILLFLSFNIVIYMLFSVVKFQYRIETWGNNINLSIGQRLYILKELVLSKGNIELLRNNEKKTDGDNFFWRFSYQASALAFVLKETPGNIPYWNGESYKLFSKLIPRFLWPGKPQEILGQEFGHRYGILGASDTNTSMNTPILVESYMNFGQVGMYLMMILFGVLYAYLDRKFNTGTNFHVNKIIGIALLFPLLIHESNFTMVFGNIPLNLVALQIIINMGYKNKVSRH